MKTERTWFSVTIGEKILNMRKARGWSQEELAERIGVTRQAVSRWESDAAKPDADKIISLCVLFSVSADYLLGLSELSEQADSASVQKNESTIVLPAWKRLLRGTAITLICICVLCLIGLTVLHYVWNDGPVYSVPTPKPEEVGVVELGPTGFTLFLVLVYEAEWIFPLCMLLLLLCIAVIGVLHRKEAKNARVIRS